MIRAYEMLLRLYPGSHRLAFAREMSIVFAQSLEDRRKQGWVPVAVFLVSELFGVLREAAALRLAGEGAKSLNLTRMRAPEVSRESYVTAIDEVLNAQRMVAFNLRRMQEAIAIQAFADARFYSDEDRKAREHLRIVREKYGISE
jgi:hypothetical protein